MDINSKCQSEYLIILVHSLVANAVQHHHDNTYVYLTGTNKCHEIVVVRKRSETHCSQFVKASKELVEQFDQLLSAAGR